MIFPSAHLSPGAFALVAMAAVFVPLRARRCLYRLRLRNHARLQRHFPLMLACVIADMIALRYLPSSIMTEKLNPPRIASSERI